MSNDARREVARQLQQRLESLRRAGLDRVPVRWPEPGARSALMGGGAEPEPDVVSPVVAPAAGGRGEAGVEVRPVLPAGSLFGEEALGGPEVPAEARAEALAEVVAGCVRCQHLAESRTQTVFGVGHPRARLMFIGEAPGAEEDRQGEPFVGKAGQLLTDMITKGMGLRREDVYIANILKCRPPGNRDPEPGEVANCVGYLEQQISVVRPEYLCLLGRISAQTLLDTTLPLSRLRGKWHRYRGVPALVTYHPAALLRTPAWKKDAWADLQMIMRAMGLKIPERGKKSAEPEGA